MTWPTKTDFVDGDVLTAAQVNNIGTNLNLFDPTSATNGQVWTANGSGSGSYATPTSGSMTLLTTSSLASLSSITTSSISSDYTHLYFDLTGMYAGATGYWTMYLNNGGSYNTIGSYQGPSNTTATTDATYNLGSNLTPSAANARTIGTTSTQPTRISGWVYNYTQTSRNYFVQFFIGRVAATSMYLGVETSLSAAINRLDFVFNTTLTAGTYTLYGVK